MLQTIEQIKLFLEIAGKKPAIILNFVLMIGIYFLWQDNLQQRMQIQEQGALILKIKDEVLVEFKALNERLLQQKDAMLEVKDQSMEAQKRLYENYMGIKRIKQK